MLNVEMVRTHFPALESKTIFFDNPAGTQVAQEVIQRLEYYYRYTNANHGETFQASQESDAVVDEARRAVADFLNAAHPEEIVFGQNMTSLTFHISRSISRLLQPGDEIVVTRLDHDANIAPWLLIAEDRGCQVRWVDFHLEDCTLDMEDLTQAITPRTRLVALTYASNAVGTIVDIEHAIQLAHTVGALCFIDAVQYAPHRPIDVQALDCDLLACSVYKFFGPHLGILYGKYDLLDRLTAYRVRPAGNKPPTKFETGTQSFEAIAGTLGALEYLGWLGSTFGADSTPHFHDRFQGRALALKQAMAAITEYETKLNLALLNALHSVKHLHIWGITSPKRMNERVPTFSFSLENQQPQTIAWALAQQDIGVRTGDFYALTAIERLGLQKQGGLVRVGLAHYNTYAEIERLSEVLHCI